MILRVVLHSGYPVHARTCPNRPRFRTIGRPQFSHVSSSSSVPCASAGSSSFVLSQSGYRLQAREIPNLTALSTISPSPHLSHGVGGDVGCPSLKFGISLAARFRSFLNLL